MVGGAFEVCCSMELNYLLGLDLVSFSPSKAEQAILVQNAKEVVRSFLLLRMAQDVEAPRRDLWRYLVDWAIDSQTVRSRGTIAPFST
jgi:hypothetical protein